MKKLFTLAVMAVTTFAGVSAASAQGRTVVVFRNRPAAINAAPRFTMNNSSFRYRSPQYFANRSMGNYGAWGYYNNLAWRPYSGRGYFGMRNGYVGGLENIPDIVIQIPPRSGRPPIHATYINRNPGNSHGGGRPGGGGGGNGSHGGGGGMGSGGGGRGR